ncbi:MAG: hypothetical protein NW208_00690 [Bryobacter sp.]|nr:hypothetical protein [Bryobacter sp.]
MNLEIQELVIPGLLSSGLLACLWLTLTIKMEARRRDGEYGRRIGLLEERLTQQDFQKSRREARQPLESLSLPLLSTSRAETNAGFTYQVPLPAALPAAPKRPLPAPEPELMPEQLDFLASLQAGKHVAAR